MGEIEALGAVVDGFNTHKANGNGQLRQPLGARLPKNHGDRIKAIAGDSPDPVLRAQILDTLLATGVPKDDKPPALLRRRDAGILLLNWLREKGTFVRSETDERFYLFYRDRRLLSLDNEAWAAFLYSLTGANPAGTEFAYLSADCKTAAINAERRPVLRVAAWDAQGQVLRVSRFDGTVYVLDGAEIREEANGEAVLFADDLMWSSYEPDYTAPGRLYDLTTTQPNFATPNEGDRERYGLAFRVWILSTFFTEYCPTRPPLGFVGEKGGGKSMSLRVFLRSMHGNTAQLSGVPDKPDGFTASAAAAHILALDNLDAFHGWMQDKIARLSTGAVDEYRKLYTSNDVGRVRYRTWLAFTSRTPDTLRRDDLADRLVLLPVERIAEGDLKAERAFLAETDAGRGRWWGDVLKALNSAVAAIRAGKLTTKSTLRMADWETLGRLIAECEGRGDVWTAFVQTLKTSQANLILEGSPIVDGLDMWLANTANHGRDVSARELYNELTALLFGDKRPTSDWPKSAKSFGKQLAGIRRELRKLYEVDWTKDRADKFMYRFTPLKAADSAPLKAADSAGFAGFAECVSNTSPKFHEQKEMNIGEELKTNLSNPANPADDGICEDCRTRPVDGGSFFCRECKAGFGGAS